ncbi:MAG: hypothetical protein ACRBF0_11775 [Calditrichia bacterium]
MTPAQEQMPLVDLLKLCCDRSSPKHGEAWLEFMERYRPVMENAILKRCRSWDARQRLPLQLKDVANDILGRVLEQLVDRDFKTLSTFRNPDSQAMFCAYLIQISRNAASAYLKKWKFDRMTGEDPIDWQSDKHAQDDSLAWEIYESRVSELRDTRKRRRPGNLERDIHIFLLYRWSDFDQSMILSHPYLRNIGHRVVDLVANRMGEKIKQGYQTPDA